MLIPRQVVRGFLGQDTNEVTHTTSANAANIHFLQRDVKFTAAMSIAPDVRVPMGVAMPQVTDVKQADNLLYLCANLGALVGDAVVPLEPARPLAPPMSFFPSFPALRSPVSLVSDANVVRVLLTWGAALLSRTFRDP
jgi:hypothetical protein